MNGTNQDELPGGRSFLNYAIAIVLGFATGVFCFLLWAILERGAQ